MRFQYFTFFINEVGGALFEANRAKIEILTDILTRKDPIAYKHRGVDLAYSYVKRQDNYIVAKIGRKSQIKRHLPPNEGFKVKGEENWPCCGVVFNLSTDPQEGQRIAFEYKIGVFSSPHEQLKNFSEKINETLATYGYVISINPITEHQEFWKLIRNGKGKIEKLTLTFEAPNLFRLQGSLNEDLNRLKERFNLNKATIELENSEGKLAVPEDDEFIKEGAEYITRGGGQYAIKLKGGKSKKILKSTDNIVTKSFEFEDLEFITDNDGVAKETLKQILG